VFNTEHLSSMFERVIVASGTSNRQTKALAASVRDSVRSRGMQVLATEGEDNGEWIIVDCGAAVAHIMQPEIRRYYHLEEIWGEKPVALKRAAARGLVKAEEAAPAAKKPVAKKAAPSRAAAPAAKNAPAKKAAVKKAPARKAPARKAAPAKSVPAKRPAAKKPAAKKAPKRA
jgi:ribosome-associated protein